MAASNPPVNAAQYIVYVALQDMANPGSYKANPTLASGDVKISIDGGAFANIDTGGTLPAVTPAAGIAVKVTVSATQMTGDNIFIQFIDQTSPKEWADYAFNIQTTLANAAANLVQVDGVALGTHASGQVPSDARDILGTAISTPATAGILDINLKNVANVAVSTTSAQIGVNAVNIGGTSQTGADVGSLTTEINADADEIITTLGAAGAGLTAIPDSATITEINADVDEIISTLGAAGAGLTAIPDSSTVTEIGADVDELITTLGTPASATVSADIATLTDSVSRIAIGSSAINTTATSGTTVTTGTVASGTYASTVQLDGVYFQIQDATGTLDMYFEFDVGTNGVPVEAIHTGRVTSAIDSLKVYAYNWAGASWDQIGTLVGIGTTVNSQSRFDLTTAHVGTGGNLGLVRVRFQATALVTANFYTDQILLAYSAVPDNSDVVAIKAKTDQLTFGVANQADVNVKSVNGTAQAAGDVTTIVTENGADTDELITTIGVAGAGLTALGDTRIANLDATVSSRTKPADTQARVTLVDTLTTYTGNTLQTGDSFARIGANGAGLTAIPDSATLTEVGADVDELITTVGAAGAGLTAIPDSATLTEVGADVDEIIVTIGAAGAGLTALPASTLTTGERNAIADAYLDRADAIEVGLTPRGAHRLEAASAAGKVSGAATSTVKLRSAVSDSKDRITATVDADGNRTAITTDVS